MKKEAVYFYWDNDSLTMKKCMKVKANETLKREIIMKTCCCDKWQCCQHARMSGCYINCQCSEFCEYQLPKEKATY